MLTGYCTTNPTYLHLWLFSCHTIALPLSCPPVLSSLVVNNGGHPGGKEGRDLKQYACKLKIVMGLSSERFQILIFVWSLHTPSLSFRSNVIMHSGQQTTALRPKSTHTTWPSVVKQTRGSTEMISSKWEWYISGLYNRLVAKLFHNWRIVAQVRQG